MTESEEEYLLKVQALAKKHGLSVGDVLTARTQKTDSVRPKNTEWGTWFRWTLGGALGFVGVYIVGTLISVTQESLKVQNLHCDAYVFAGASFINGLKIEGENVQNATKVRVAADSLDGRLTRNDFRPLSNKFLSENLGQKAAERLAELNVACRPSFLRVLRFNAKEMIGE